VPAFLKKLWLPRSNPASTPIRAADLNRMEQGIEDAIGWHKDLAGARDHVFSDLDGNRDMAYVLTVSGYIAGTGGTSNKRLWLKFNDEPTGGEAGWTYWSWYRRQYYDSTYAEDTSVPPTTGFMLASTDWNSDGFVHLSAIIRASRFFDKNNLLVNCSYDFMSLPAGNQMQGRLSGQGANAAFTNITRLRMIWDGPTETWAPGSVATLRKI
jgi:hypothetical protein